MVFSFFLNILTQSIAITDSMFNFDKFFTKNAITFDLTEIERKNTYLIGMKFCCASNAAIKMSKSQEKLNFSSKTFLTKSPFFLKSTDF